ncbi:MAG: ROK family transcriptional regulator, partial [Anaerolineales bacterium]|nr:ROK family transcriptional regulator [Anaerolineales bacterium]
MKKATRQQTKSHNTRLILKTIYEQGNVSRADLARLTRLTRPTVSSIVAELMARGLVAETGQGPSAGGKRPTWLDIVDDAQQLICIDLGSQLFRGAVVNLRGDIVARQSFARDDQTGDEAVALVYRLLDALAADATAPLLGIGVGTPGLVDPQHGVVKQAVNLGWSDLHLGELLQARYDTAVYVANDSHLAALAEYTYGPPRHSQHLILIKVGQGIGAGIVVNGQLLVGDGFGAGEIGHVVVAENGAP